MVLRAFFRKRMGIHLRSLIHLILLASLGVGMVANLARTSATVISMPQDSGSAKLIKVENSIRMLEASLNKNRAKAMAEASPGFISESQKYPMTFNGLSTGWSERDNAKSISLTWLSVNVIYSFSDANRLPKNLVVTEDPTSYEVVSIAKQDATRINASTSTITPTCLAPPQTRTASISPQNFCEDWTLAADPTSLSLSATYSGTSTIKVYSIGSFYITVSLSASVSGPCPCPGLSTSFDPTAVTPPIGGMATSTLMIGSTADTSPGTYTVTVTGSSPGYGSRAASINVTVSNPSCAGTSRNSQTGAGYEFFACSSTSHTIPTYEVTTSWTVPRAYNPSGACTWNHCDLGVWAGLVNQIGGAGSCGGQSVGCLVQAGSDSGQYCTIGCGPNNDGYYWAWYEFPPAGPVHIWDDIRPGDSMTVDVISEKIFGGDPYTYEMYVWDNSLSRVYHLTPTHYDMGLPYYADVIAERPGVTLPQFDTFSYTGCSINSRQPSLGYSTCYNLRSTQVNMVNCAYSNIITGPVNSDSSFTLTWITSACT